MIIERNTAIQYGGGLYAFFTVQGGSLDLDHVVVRANTVIAGTDHNPQGEGGGAWVGMPSAANSFDLRDSQVSSNTAADVGGGLRVGGDPAAPRSIERSVFYSNTATYGAAMEISGSLSLFDSQLHDNHATYWGGAANINFGAAVVISRTTLAANTAGLAGGGVYMLEHANTTPGLTIVESTLSGNFAPQGGGIYNFGSGSTDSSALVLVNSTLSGNVTSHDGGGLYTDAGQTELFNATIASNRVEVHIGQPDAGGGLYLTHTAVLTAEDTIMANNVRGSGISIGVPDDCYSHASTVTLFYSLILNTTNCPISAPVTGDLFGQDPLLGPVAE